MGQSQKIKILSRRFILVLLITCCLSFLAQSSATKGRVIEIVPNSVQYLANSFDQILVFFLQQRNDEYEVLFEEFVKDINSTYPNDHTLYAVTYFKNDTLGKLAKFNNKSDGFRIITKRNHYQMDFNNQIRQFQLLKRFYSNHVHPVLPLLVPQQFPSIETQYFVVMQYNSVESLKKYLSVYPKIYDFLKIFNVRAIGLQSTRDQTKVQIYKKSDTKKPIATYGNQLDNTDELIDFINVETLPYLPKLNDQNYYRIFGSFLDTQFLLIYDQKNEDSPQIQIVRQQLIQASIYNREQELKYHRTLFAEGSTQFLARYFDESLQQMQSQRGQLLPFRVVLTKTDYGKFQLRRFNYDQETHGKYSHENLIKFIDDVRMKRIDAEFKSERIPVQQQQQKSILRKIVGKSFISQVFQKPDQSVIVLFIDSKDQKSYKEIKQVFQNFTVKYKQILEGKVVCAMFDLARNQNKLLTIKNAPVLSLFQKSTKKSAKNFKGYPKVQSMKDWVNYEVNDVTIPQNFGEQILFLGSDSLKKSQNVAEQL